MRYVQEHSDRQRDLHADRSTWAESRSPRRRQKKIIKLIFVARISLRWGFEQIVLPAGRCARRSRQNPDTQIARNSLPPTPFTSVMLALSASSLSYTPTTVRMAPARAAVATYAAARTDWPRAGHVRRRCFFLCAWTSCDSVLHCEPAHRPPVPGHRGCGGSAAASSCLGCLP